MKAITRGIGFLLLFSLNFSGHLVGQQIASEPFSMLVDIDEEVSELNREAYENDLEAKEELRVRPVDLNCMQASELERIFWLNPFQIQSIQAYIKRNGRIKSLYEIAYIHGFTNADMASLSPYIYLSDGRKTFKHRWQSETKQRMDSQGRIYSQMKTAHTGDFDTELKLFWFNQTTRYPDAQTLSGSLQWKGKKILKQVILGDYGLKWGQGLLVHQGLFKPFDSPVSQMNSNYRALALAQNTSYPHYRGIYMRMAYGTLQTALGFSIQDSAQTFARVFWNNSRVSCSLECLHSLKSGDVRTGGDLHIHFSYLQFFGAFALQNKGMDVQAGVLLLPGYLHRTGILLYSNSLAQGFSYLYEQNHKNIQLQWRLDRNLWRFPRYRVSMPSEETIQKILIGFPVGSAQLKYNWNKRISSINPPSGWSTLSFSKSNIKSVQASERQRHRLGISWKLRDQWNIQTEYQFCRYDLNQISKVGNSVSVYAKRQMSNKNHTYSMQCTWYLSDSFDAALYVNEPSFLMRFSIPALYGEGLRWNMQWAYTPTRNQLYSLECVYQNTWKCMATVRIRWGN